MLTRSANRRACDTCERRDDCPRLNAYGDHTHSETAPTDGLLSTAIRAISRDSLVREALGVVEA